jgi:hypothetical protein
VAKQSETGGELLELVREIVQDSRQLLGQQIELAKSEVGDELRRVAGAGVSVAAGGGLAAAGGLMSGLMLVHLIRRVTGLPIWACYGLLSGSLGAAGLALIRSGRETFAELQFPPPQTTKAVEENLEWLQDQLTPATR